MGAVASGESFLIRSGGCELEVSLGTAGVDSVLLEDIMDVLLVLTRLGRGELGRGDGGGCALAWSIGGGVDVLVMFGRR